MIVILMMFNISQGGIRSENWWSYFLLLTGGGIGGFAGGLIAGLVTMMALRPNAPSISWKHMSPTIGIWGISGLLGMIVSGLVTAFVIAVGMISVPSADTDCSGIGFGDCLGQIIGGAIGEAIGIFILTLLVFLFFVITAWFLTGVFAGWLAVRHIRRLEPGITNSQGWRVSVGWGCGAIVAAVVMIFLVGILSSALGL